MTQSGSDLLLALSAQVEAIRDHLTQAVDHIIELGRISDALKALPPTPTVPAWYARIPIGTHLRVIRESGIQVYVDSGLSQAWAFGRKGFGDQGMTVHAAWDAAYPLALCVLEPTPPRYPTGLWIAHTGNDGNANVEMV